MADAIALAKGLADQGSPTLDQLAFADFLGRGELDRHLRRMRPMYRVRRDALLAALGRRPARRFRPVGASAGLHILAWLPPSIDEVGAGRAARAVGIRLEGLTTRGFERPARAGSSSATGRSTRRAIERGIRQIGGLVAAMEGRRRPLGERLEPGREVAEGRRLRFDDPEAAQVGGSRRDGAHDLDDVVDVALRVGPARDRQADEVHRRRASPRRRDGART